MDWHKYFNECFDYNPTTGVLRWKSDRPDSHFKTTNTKKRWKQMFSGNVVGTPNKAGFLQVAVSGKSIDIHRAIWIMTHGSIPMKTNITHINGIGTDNRMDNLRLNNKSKNLCRSTDDRTAPFNLPERFWEKIMPEPNTGCWIWTGATYANGYGACGMGGSVTGAHRAVYAEAVGVIPKGLSLDHLCRVPLCVNPRHLEPVTHRENILRGTSPIAMQAMRVQCVRGHELLGDNVYWEKTKTGSKKRHCRQCAKDRRTMLYQEKKSSHWTTAQP